MRRGYKVKPRLKTVIKQYKLQRKIFFIGTTVLLGLGILFYLGKEINRYMATSDWFLVKTTVIEGNLLTDADKLQNYLNFEGKNLFAVSSEEIALIEEMIRGRFPEIKQVAIKRRPPSKILIKLHERVPVAEIAAANKRVGVDEDLAQFSLSDEYRQIPKITGALKTTNLAVCVKFLKRIQHMPIYDLIDWSTARSSTDLEIGLKNSCKVLLGDPADSDYKIPYMARIIGDLEMRGLKASYINMQEFSKDYKEAVVMPLK